MKFFLTSFLMKACCFFILIVFKVFRIFLGIKWSLSIFDVLKSTYDRFEKLVEFRGQNLRFYASGSTAFHRVDTFLTKEPEIFEWFDSFAQPDRCLYDIGANVGLYSVVAAKSYGCSVVSFEPSVFNLGQLVKNINVNEMSNSIKVVPIALARSSGFGMFRLASTEEGAALNAFDVDYGFDGERLNHSVEYATIGITLDDFVALGMVDEFPSLIKIDVDGAEHEILEGARKVLSDVRCISVYVEVNDQFRQHSVGVAKVLHDCGFRMESKNQSNEFLDTPFESSYNQIWVKKQ